MNRGTFILLLFFIFTSCSKDEGNSPIFDRPINFKATKGEFVEKIVLSWTDSPQADRYQVFRFNISKDEYSIIGETADNSYIDSTIDQVNNNYYYKVRVFNSKSEYSNFSDFDYGYISAFVKPTNLKVSQGDSENFISLGWSNVLGATEYLIYRSATINGNFELFGKSNTNSFNDINTEPSVEYYYKIKAHNPSLGDTDFSDIAHGYRLQQYTLLHSFGSAGEFSHPIGVVVDKEDNIYVSENWNNQRVQKFDSSGNYKSVVTWGDNPYGIFYYEDSLFISKNTPGKIYCFNMNGDILYDWGNGYGTNSDQFRGVWSMTFDNNHNMYVDDRGNNRIKKYNAKKELISTWEGFDNPYALLYFNGEILLSDNKGLYRYSLDGVFLSKINFISESTAVSFIAKDKSNNIYLANSKQVIKMDAQFRIIAKFGNFESTYGLCVNSKNKVIVSDYSANRVYIYSPGD